VSDFAHISNCYCSHRLYAADATTNHCTKGIMWMKRLIAAERSPTFNQP
jgi:hypothetical protein